MRWCTQGTYDPDEWVQSRVVDGMIARIAEPSMVELLTDYALRTSGDPYARARAAHALVDAGHGDALSTFSKAWAGRESWRAAPLALVSARTGDETAKLVVEEALRAGEYRDDLDFLVALGTHGWPALDAAIEEGSSWTEGEDLGIRLDLARARLGSAVGLANWRGAIRTGDVFAQRDAMDLLLALPVAEREAWAKDLVRAKDRSVRALGKALLAPSARTLRAAWSAADDIGRVEVMRLIGSVGAEGLEPVVAAGLVDEQAEVRSAAAATVGVLGLDSLASGLNLVAVDDRAEVRAVGNGARYALQAR